MQYPHVDVWLGPKPGSFIFRCPIPSCGWLHVTQSLGPQSPPVGCVSNRQDTIALAPRFGAPTYSTDPVIAAALVTGQDIR